MTEQNRIIFNLNAPLGEEGGNMAEEKEKSKKEGAAARNYGIAAVALVAAIAAFVYFWGYAALPPAAPPSNGTAAPPLATPEARLLMASFDRGAELADYTLRYSSNDNGMKSSYALFKNGSSSWVGVSGVFGKMEGFFGPDNSTDTVCLEYEGELKCAMAGNDSDMAGVAASLKILRPNKVAYLNQKEDTRKLISTGAIMLSSGLAEEKVGLFETQRITYALDYSNLTVQQMISLGISPSDETLLAITDQTVTFWIDKKSGLMVKSHATYKNMGVPGFFDTEYSEVRPFATLPEKPGTLVVTEAFVDFYSKSTADYSRRASCSASSGRDRDSCFKSIAVEKSSWETCKLINDSREYESCTLIVAQNTRNHVLCGTLGALVDECYISVAGETGNFELCRNLKNASMGTACNQAATSGQMIIEKREAEAAKIFASRNCAVDLDCMVFGNANQYCAPKNTTKEFANDTSPLFACLKGIPCGCQAGFCGFAKNESYYACMNRVEDELLEEYIKNLIPGNQTASASKVG
jgi:hypothetical protein